jgi:hypothetical protein
MARGIEAFKAGSSLLSQLVTVSAGLLTFTVTFVEKFRPPATTGAPLSAPTSIKLCWIFLVLAMIFGFWASAAVVGSINRIESEVPENKTYSNINIPTALMLISFLAWIVALMVAGFRLAG